MKSNYGLLYVVLALVSVNLQAADTTSPLVYSMSPAPGSTVSNLTQVNVVFTEPVTWVEAWDLQINDTDAAMVTGVGYTNFTFTFTQPPAGPVTMSWESTQNITDLSGNPFAGGAPWQYNLVDVQGPTVIAALPMAGVTVGQLKQVTVTFSEPVIGIDAGDLLVNDAPCRAISGSGAGPYTFQVAEYSVGPNTVAWNPASGITDLASNALVLTNWIITCTDGYVPTLRLNEFITSNVNTNTGLRDEFGNLQDWIEIYNYGSSPVDLTGISLAEDPTVPGEWVFPSMILGGNQYLVVFASALDRRVLGGTNKLHTNFKLSPYAGYLGLFDAQNPPVELTGVNYPDQKNDYSYGLDSSNNWRYCVTLTPGSANITTTSTNVVEEVHFSVERGIFSTPFILLLSDATPGAAIRYTTDGSVPTVANGYTYTNGIPVTNTAIIRAAGFFTNMLPSAVQTHTYIFPDGVIRQSDNPPGFPTNNLWSQYTTIPSDYGMDPKIVTNPLYSASIKNDLLALPSLSIVMNVDDMFGVANGIYTHAQVLDNPAYEKPCSVEWINPDGTKGFQSDAGIKMHGGGSRARTLKHPMRLGFKGRFGPTSVNFKMYADSPATDYDGMDLRSEYNDHWNHGFEAAQRARGTQIRDQWFKDVERAMGGIAGHANYVHLYINGLYWGVYSPCERPDAAFAARYLGGDKDQYDAVNGSALRLADGNWNAHNALLAINNLDIPAQYELMKQNLDINQYIDYMILQIYGANLDWGNVKNWYSFRKREDGATWKYICWDSERTLEGTNDLPMGVSSVGALNSVSPDGLQAKLVANPEYRLTFADRVYKHLFNDGALTYANILASWSVRSNQLDRAVNCEAARWGDMLTYDSNVTGYGKRAMSPLPYPSYNAAVPYYSRNENWLGEQSRLFTNYFPVRGNIVLNQFRAVGLYPAVEPPTFSQHGGRVVRGFTLTMSAPATNQIFYTTNGVDPRVYGSGVAAATAVLYSTPLNIGDTMVVKARCLSGTNWSALHEATFTIGDLLPPLRITEIMYNPIGGDNFEFLELQNIGSTPLDISGYYFDGINFIFASGTILNAGARIVLGSNNDTNAWKLRYPGVSVAGWYGAKLADSGEPIRIYNPSNQVVLLVDYKPANGWPTLANGAGYSLEIIDPEGDPNDPANWQASAAINGTPGLASVQRPVDSIVINEVMADNLTAVEHEGTFPDWIELYNPGPGSVDLLGWSVSDDGNPGKFTFTDTTVLQAGDYLVLWCDSPTNGTSGFHTDFALDRNGDSVYLFDPNTNRVDAISFGPQVTDYTLGRVGGLWKLTQPTPNQTNIAAVVGAPSSLLINEWMANAVKGGTDWIEIYNFDSNAPVSLRNVYVGTSNALSQIKAYSFIGPNCFVQLVADNSSGARHLDFKLPAEGGYVALFDENGMEIYGSRITYGPQVEGVSQGRLPDASLTYTSFPGSPSPGAPNYRVSPTGVLLNEVLASHYRATTNSAGRITDWVELFNSSNTNFDVSGWSLSVNASERNQWVFPPGSIIAPQDYLVVWCDGDKPVATNSQAYLNTGHSIDGDSSGVYLFNSSGQIVDSVEFGSQVEDKSIGRSGGTWQLLASPTPGRANSDPAVLGSALNLRINEWMASPAIGDDWFELYNLDGVPVQLSGLYLTDDPTVAGTTNFMIPTLSFIGGNGFVKFVADGSQSKGRNHVNFNMDGWGESISLYNRDLNIIDRVNYGVQPGGVSQGRLPDGALNIVSFPGTATPGQSNYQPLPNAQINEVLSHAVAPQQNTVELFNPTPVATPLDGWYLSNDERNFKKYRIPNGTVLPAGGFLVLNESQFSSSFTLDAAKGEDLWLSQTDGNDNLTGYRARAHYGAGEENVSFVRYQTSTGIDYPASTLTTFGQTNADPRVGPVVINELMYHPPDIGGTNDNGVAEFIELYNLSGNTVLLYDSAHPTNGWRLQGGVNYTFTNCSLPPGGYLLVVSFDPRTNAAQTIGFKIKYGLPGNSTNIFGPYAGRLDNGGEEILLTKPGSPVLVPPAPELYVPQIVVDRVEYSDSNPWPSGADGTPPDPGLSLQRKHPGDYGNEPLNWFAGSPTAGTANGTPTSPSIVQNPQSTQVGIGTSASLTVTASGSGALSYLWFFNGNPIREATNAVLNLYNVQPANEGLYAVAVASSNATAYSQPAFLTVVARPQILQPPRSQGAAVGATATFSVFATGGGLSYQWQFNGANLLNETNPTLTLPNVDLSDAGPYRVLISNAVSSVFSDPAYLVMTPPSIVVDPVGMTNLSGTTMSVSVTANGDPPLTYQWRKDSIPVYGATNATYTVPNAPSSVSGVYDVIVVNALGRAVSQTASVAIYTPVQIDQQPADVVVLASDYEGHSSTNVLFTANASGTAPITYQWLHNGTAVPGANASSLFMVNPNLADDGYYSLAAWNPYTAITSAPARLLMVVKPSIRQAPPHLTVVTGSVVNLPVVATANPMPLTFIWRKDRSSVVGGSFTNNSTNCTLTLNNVTASTAGGYTVMVNNAYTNGLLGGWTAVSPIGFLTAVVPPTNQYVKAGTNVTLNVTASCGTNTSRVRFQWQCNGTNLSSMTNNTLTLTNFQADREGIYTVLVSSTPTNPTPFSAEIFLSSEPPMVVTQPQNAIVAEGASASFGVVAAGPPPLSYQWRVNGANLLNATNRTLTLPAVQNSDLGEYTVFISNTNGSVMSLPATLSIGQPPSITSQPQPQTPNLGDTASFTVVATGTAPLYYQWRFNGANLLNETNATLTLANVQASHVGDYTVVITNVVGAVTSAPASLTLNSGAPSILVQPAAKIANPGDTVTFTVTASGEGTLTYQWRLNNVIIPGATNDTYSCAATYSLAGIYTVNVSSGAATTSSDPAELTVRPRFTLLTLTNGVLVLNYEGVIGKTYSLDAATRLTNWVNYGQLSNISVQMQFQDTNALAGTNALYRLRLVP